MTANGRESKKSNICVYTAGVGLQPQGYWLKYVFDRYIEEEISDEQIRRVLDPVLRLIREGKFSRPRHRKSAARPALSVLSVLSVAIVAAFAAGVS